MFKSNWGACAFGVLLTVSSLSSGKAFAAANSCGDNTEARLSDFDKRLTTIEALLRQDPAASRPAVACSSLDRSKAIQVGTRCTTSKGALYVRVSKENFGEAWKGPDGVIWSDYVGSKRNTGDVKGGIIIDSEATRLCKTLGGNLPERADFERGEANDFREVLPNMKDRYFWSSSVNPNVSGYAGDFNGSSGNFVYYRNYSDSVRCVGR